jgi:signal transduction histidine kinase
VANLIDNAVKFSPASSIVKVVVQSGACGSGRTTPAMAISVLDRGSGVAPDHRERIFQPFEQGGDPAAPKPSGIGIGLYEARTMARRHGGGLEYRPREGGGSEFRLVVPLAPETESASAEAPEENVEVARV